MTGRMRWKRENIVKMVEDQVKEDADALAEKTGLLPWQVLLIASIILLSLVGVTVFCLYRFCAKKRAKKGESKKNIDEQRLVDGEEEVDILEEEVIKVKSGRNLCINSNLYCCEDTQEDLPGEAPVRAEVRLQHPDLVCHSVPGYGATSYGYGRGIRPLC